MQVCHGKDIQNKTSEEGTRHIYGLYPDVAAAVDGVIWSYGFVLLLLLV